MTKHSTAVILAPIMGKLEGGENNMMKPSER